MKKRILGHWNRQKEFDHLICGKIEESILSIDSFGALDTTRIFYKPCRWHEKDKNDNSSHFFTCHRFCTGIPVILVTWLFFER